MARLIDADELKKDYPHDSDWEYPVNTNEYVCESIDNAPTVEAIPKADYENRLKADMVAMLTEIQLEMEENTVCWYVGRVDGKSDDVVLMETINDIIQKKINALKAEIELQESEG